MKPLVTAQNFALTPHHAAKVQALEAEAGRLRTMFERDNETLRGM